MSQEHLGFTCIDGGKCHHECTDKCYRRLHCGPFSDYSGPWSYYTMKPLDATKFILDFCRLTNRYGLYVAWDNDTPYSEILAAVPFLNEKDHPNCLLNNHVFMHTCESDGIRIITAYHSILPSVATAWLVRPDGSSIVNYNDFD